MFASCCFYNVELVILGIIKFICTFSRIVLFLHKNKKLLVYENERAVDR